MKKLCKKRIKCIRKNWGKIRYGQYDKLFSNGTGMKIIE